MASMFYSLQEAAEKLDITKEQVEQLVREGRLRQFRDGSNVLFKVDEVEALMSDTSIMAAKAASAESEQGTDEDEISLAPEATEDTEDMVAGGDLTDADTIVADQGVDALGETSGEAQLTDDTLAETKGTTGEASLEEIEEDVNLDTFGSGSGLLDLSLQADDTSLGGILDEIYTPEGEQEAGEGAAVEAVEVAAEAEEMLPEEELVVSEPTPEVPAIAQAYVEPEPDVQSNVFGMMLFLPLLVIVYTAIVAVAAFNNVMPAILGKIQGIIWHVMAGAVVAAGLIVGAAFMLGGAGAKAGKRQKAKKPKKSKKAKAKSQSAPESESA